MGNGPSKNPSGSAPQHPPPRLSTPAAATSHAPPANINHAQQHLAGRERAEPRRRESIQALLQKATAKPSPNLESVTAHTVPVSSSQRSAEDALRSQSTARHQPPPQATPPPLRPVGALAEMGNQESKHSWGKDKEKGGKKGVQSPKSVKGPPASTPPNEKPEQHPAVSSVEALSVPEDDLDRLPPAEYNRPPRLPLPIEEEDYAPGSPIISPADLQDVVEPLVTEGLPRRASVLSSTTADDEEDVANDVEVPSTGVHPGVPTIIEWRGQGEKVYVTGTFAGWDRKFRLHRNGPSNHKDAFSAIISLQPGTHHLSFLVDGDMKLSTYLPTAVDFAGFLVNYIEVVPEAAQASSASAPVDIPTANKQLPEQPAPVQEYAAPPGVHPPQVLPPTPELIPVYKPPPPPAPEKAQESKGVKIAPGPEKHYHNEIPRFLLDLDAPEDSTRLARASAVVNTLPAPPSLPLFLGKSILNGNTPMKDDASVLMMPNHTVLNHLATSSIRNKVLATSATTRYKKKFLTTIMYKPTSEASD